MHVSIAQVSRKKRSPESIDGDIDKTENNKNPF